MKILICGASGLAGRVLYNYFKKKFENYEIIGTYNNNKTSPDLIKIDFFNNKLINTIEKINPDIVINCIAERQNENCENNWDFIKKINIDITDNISKVCGILKIYLIHLSTDYVYDGQNPPFSCFTNTNPLQNYGISKLIAEKRIKNNIQDFYLILRVPVLYSENLKSLEESAVPIITKKIFNRVEKFNEDHYSIRRPLYIKDLAYFISKLFSIKNRLYGVHCFYNPYDKYTKYEILKLGSKILNKEIDHVIPIINKGLYEKAVRPKDTSMYDPLINFSDYKITTLEKGLKKVLNKFIHPKINLDALKIDNKNMFFMIDFDGTVLDNELFNFKCYHEIFLRYNIILNYDEYINYSHKKNINDLILEHNLKIEDIKKEKYELMEISLKKNNDLKFKNGFLEFFEYLDYNYLNYCIVSNSSKKSIDIYKKYIPKLKSIKNWILREDYNLPKPNPECYNLALNKYYKNEEFIIGFENSLVGYESLKHITDKIYILTDKNYLFYNELKKKDVYLIDNYLQL